MELITQIQQQETHLWTISWHPTKNIIAVAGSQKKITLWAYNQDFKDCYKTQVIIGDHLKTIRSIEFSPNGQMLCSGSFDNYLIVYVLAEGEYQFLTKLEGHQSQIKCVSWSPNNKKIASCSRDKNIWIWEYQPQNFDFICSNVLEGHKQDIKYVKWINNFKLASSSYDDTIKIWEADDDDYTCTQTLQKHESIVWCIEISRDEKKLYSVSQDKSLKIWREENDKYILKNELKNLHQRPIYSCSLNLTNKILVTGGGDNKIVVIYVDQQNKNQQQIKHKQFANSHLNDINCVKFNPRHQKIFGSCSDDNKIKIWKIL